MADDSTDMVLEGVAEALRRIAAANESGAKELDLGGLGLDDAAMEHHVGANLAELTWLETLHFGLDAKARDRRSLLLTDEEKKRCNAVRALPAAITALPQLKHLNLEWNQLATLPPEIGRLTALTHLRLDGNQLATLLPEFARLTGAAARAVSTIARFSTLPTMRTRRPAMVRACIA